MDVTGTMSWLDHITECVKIMEHGEDKHLLVDVSLTQHTDTTCMLACTLCFEQKLMLIIIIWLLLYTTVLKRKSAVIYLFALLL